MIVVRDLYSSLSPLVQKFHSAGIPYDHIVLLDSGTTAPGALTVLEKLSHLGCQWIKLACRLQKYGPYVLWMDRQLPIPRELWSFPFILTDPDLAVEGLPDDWLERLFAALNQYRWASKVALGLRIDDLDCKDHEKIKAWESLLDKRFPVSFLKLLLDSRLGAVSAKTTDTTFALYRPWKIFTTLSVRLEGAYRIRHLPWYRTFEHSQEYRDYRRLKLPAFGHWS